MCGIAIHVSANGRARPLNLNLIHHRGPDSRGEWTSLDGCGWLGGTRLAIVDLSPAGAQPMIDPATGNVIVHNGEIYNHLNLRKQLGDVAWRGTSDTETLLGAYARWGQDMLAYVKGMFAFAIYNASQRELFVARDRLGIKPLYYVVDPEGIRFASEVKILVTDGESTNADRISAYLQWGASPERKLLYPNVFSFPAGHAMSISVEVFATANGRRLTQPPLQRYWPTPTSFRAQPGNTVLRVRELLERAVEQHLLSDVPVASFLSGGIDSSIVTALAAQRPGERLQTFSVGFDDPTLDESKIALEVAQRYKTDHHAIRLSEEQVLESVTEAVGKLDLPSVDAINTFVVSKAVAQHGIKVALSGLGGDELFGGYPAFRDVPRLKLLSQLPRAAHNLLGHFGAAGKRLADLPETTAAGELARWRRRFFTNAILRRAHLPNGALPLELPVELPDDFAAISWAELTGYMRRMLLRDADQMSMAVSLELRVPFLDHELVEYVLGLPAHEKQRFPRAKGLLVEACRDLLPRSVYDRPKRGFVLPMKSWMQGPLHEFVNEGLDEATVRELLPETFVDELRAGFANNRLHWTRLWAIVVLGHFAKRRQLSMHEDSPLHSLA
jgi:asparagine synthase (glutamine-hydrolysing)